MRKRKKHRKQTEQECRRIEEAHKRKAYIKRMLILVQDMGFGQAIPLLDKKNLHSLFFLRPTLAWMDISQAKEYTRNEQVYIQREFYELMHLKKLPFTTDTDENRTMSAIDFFEVWMPLMLYVERKSVKRGEEENKEKLRQIFGEQAVSFHSKAHDDTRSSLFQLLFTRMNKHYEAFLLTFLFQFSNPCMRFLWVKKMEYDTHNRRVARKVTFASRPPLYIHDTERKETSRRLFRVGFPLIMRDDVQWVSAKIPRNPYIYFNSDLGYEVYIQEHAIKRMFERLDGISKVTVNIYMNFCFLHWSADWYKGSLLIPFHLFDLRVGYFLGDFTTERKIVIRTFYFITYDRTPEGEALRSYTGLQASDKAYLSIDRLSTFLASDINKKSKLAVVFRQAGCGHLLNLSVLRNSVDENAKFRSISNELIDKYLATLVEKERQY